MIDQYYVLEIKICFQYHWKKGPKICIVPIKTNTMYLLALPIVDPQAKSNGSNGAVLVLKTSLQGCKEFMLMLRHIIFASNQNSNTMKNKKTIYHLILDGSSRMNLQESVAMITDY